MFEGYVPPSVRLPSVRPWRNELYKSCERMEFQCFHVVSIPLHLLIPKISYSSVIYTEYFMGFVTFHNEEVGWSKALMVGKGNFLWLFYGKHHPHFIGLPIFLVG